MILPSPASDPAHHGAVQLHHGLGQFIPASVECLIQDAVGHAVLHLIGNGNTGLLYQQAKQFGGAQAQGVAGHETQVHQFTSRNDCVGIGAVPPHGVEGGQLGHTSTMKNTRGLSKCALPRFVCFHPRFVCAVPRFV